MIIFVIFTIIHKRPSKKSAYIMLLRDIPPERSANRSVVNRQRYSRRRDVNSPVIDRSIAKVRKHPSSAPTKVANPVQVNSLPKRQPLWLKGLIFLNHSSALLCYGSIAITLVIYGMTVYAPKQWTHKYNELRELQKKERQFTFTEEVLKNESAKSAEKLGSGFINPNPTQQPIFLRNVDAKTIKLDSSTKVTPKKIKPISPIAY